MRNFAIAAVLVGAAAFIAHLHASMQTYHPVIKVSAPGNMTYTVVLAAASDRPACSSAGKAFVEPIRGQCPECEVVSARCERELQDLELALELDRPVPLYVVSMAGVRVAISAEDSQAKLACDYIAGDASRRGAANAACLLPRAARTN